MERVEQGQAKITVGEEVCTIRWGRGTVTKVLSKNKVTVDGVPCHILDIRKVSLSSDGRGFG